jgi:GNAT superfamily N-acetyltransferase
MRELIDTAGVAGTGATHGFIVARSINGADVLGYATPRVDDTGRRWVGALYVRPLHWHRGVGAALLRAVLDWHAIDGGLSAVVYCHVVTYNDRARRFYARFGFVETDLCPPDEGARRIGAIELPLVELARA